MKKLMVCGAACAVVAMAVAAVGAQDGKMSGMGMDAKGMEKADKMSVEKAYTGCIARSDTGTLVLTHAIAADAMKSPMSKDAMKGDAMETDGMKGDTMASDGMAVSLTLSSTAVDLTKHLHHKVTVTGVEGPEKKDGTDAMMRPFAVKSLKMVASSCS
jgi:pentapeptide MXKDX repeat protein